MEVKAEKPHTLDNKRGHLRYVIALLLLCGAALNYIIKAMLSVAIVGMVKRSSSTSNSNGTNSSSSSAASEMCQGELDEDSGSSQEGPFDWDAQVQGEILASYFYGYVATQLFGGWAADRFGGRWVFSSGMFLTGVFSLFCPEGAKLHRNVFMALRALQGVSSGVLVPSTNVLLSKWFTLQERPGVAGFVFSASFGGTLISMSVSGILVEELGWQSVFYIYGGLCIAYIVPFFYFVYNTPDVHPRLAPWERDHIINGLRENTEEVITQEVKKNSMSIPWISILLSHRFWAITFVQIGLAWLNYTMLTQLPTYTSNVLHFSIKNSGFISAMPYLAAWISAAICGSLSSWLRARGHLSRMNAYRIFTGIACIGPGISLLLVILLGCNTMPIVICFVATTVMLSAFYGGGITQHLDLASNFVGATTGIMYTIMNLVGIIMPIVNGAILKSQETITGWHTVFYITMGWSVIPYIFYLIFSTDKEQSWNNPKEEKGEKQIIHPVPQKKIHFKEHSRDVQMLKIQ